MGENAARSASGREGEAQPLQGSGEPAGVWPGGRSTAPAGAWGALQGCGQCSLPKETLLGSREAGHIGTSEKASQVAAPWETEPRGVSKPVAGEDTEKQCTAGSA